jgi:glycine betaine/proline transport system substrate-binding protein
MRALKRILSFAALALLGTMIMAATATAYDKMPGKGKEVTPARCTWDTGFFQEALARRGLSELGYEINTPPSLQNPIFYQSVFQGDVDYWAHGWFPNHKNQLPEGFYDKADTVGYVIKAGGLQGYLVSKRDVEKYNIKSLDDFRRPEVKEAFDSNGDGKADLVACPPGWGCEKVITHHFEVYDLDPHINPIKASYSASIADALANYRNGGPAFFYTWTPNWTVNKFTPGEDVMWINVPEINPLGSQAEAKERMSATGVKGAVSDPVKLGFVVSDIRVVANKKFLAENPAAKRFFEVFTLPLSDVNAQNEKMFAGEDSWSDIERHVDEWIKANKDKWESWLEEARKAA